MRFRAFEGARLQPCRKSAVIMLALAVRFQDVVPIQSIVHSTKTGEADGADQSACPEKAEWTSIRMPDLRFTVEKL
jgi:hypothetical protein